MGWVGIAMLLVIITLLLWKILENGILDSRIYTYKVCIKQVGYNAYDKVIEIEGNNPIEVLESLGVRNPIVVNNWHDAKYVIEVEGNLVGYFR